MVNGVFFSVRNAGYLFGSGASKSVNLFGKFSRKSTAVIQST